jgi:hypothetical protein
MTSPILRAALIAAAVSIAGSALAQSPGEDSGAQAGTALLPADAAGPWTLQSKGGAVCTVTLTARSAAVGGSFVATVGPECKTAYAMGGAAAWKPTHDGLAFTAGDGSVVVAFNRWSNSLFVSHRSSGADLQLSRGAKPLSP